MRKLIYFAIIITIACKKNEPVIDNNVIPGKYGDVIFLVDTFRIIDATTGVIKVSTTSQFTIPGSIISQATFEDSFVYQATTHNLTCVNANTGVLKYRTSYNYFWGSAAITPSWPVVVDSNLYVTALDATGLLKLYCHNKSNGAIRWKSSASMGSDLSAGYSTPVVSGDKIIVTSHQQYNVSPDSFGVYCFNRFTGAITWSTKSALEMNTPSAFPLIINNNKVVFTASSFSTKAVYCLDLNTGSQLWKTSFTDYVAPHEIRYYNNELVVLTNNAAGKGKINRINPNTGSIIATHDLGDISKTTTRRMVLFLKITTRPGAVPAQGK
jgi:outer membrane protein assembly factor BamB